MNDETARGWSPGPCMSRELLSTGSTFENIIFRAAYDRPTNEDKIRGLKHD